MTRRSRGYSLLEMVVAMAIFGMFLFIVTALTMSLNRSEKTWPVNLMKHPQVIAVLARLRRDVLDATPPYYPVKVGKFEQTDTTLLLVTLENGGTSRTIVWDFSVAGEAHRRVFMADEQVSEWVARGLPSKLKIAENNDFDREPVGLRIQANDEHGTLVIDQILQPRATLPADEEPEEKSAPAPAPPVPVPPVPPPTDTAPPAAPAPPTDTTATGPTVPNEQPVGGLSR